MKKCALLFCILVFIICLCCCGSNNLESTIENDEGSNGINGEYYFNSATKVSQPDWEYLDMGIFCDKVSATNEMYFLMTEEISLEGQVYKTDENNTNILLNLIQNLPVKKVKDVVSCAEYYILLRDENDMAICLIEVWDDYVCINQRDFYEVLSHELFLTIDKMISECEKLHKVSVEEILITYTKKYLYGEFDEEDIVLYNKWPAILVESGYENNNSEEEFYYEKFVYCDGLYFDKDYQTTYMLSQCKIYYCDDGSIQDTYSERMAYYDYLTGERMMLAY